MCIILFVLLLREEDGLDVWKQMYPEEEEEEEVMSFDFSVPHWDDINSLCRKSSLL